MKKKARKRSAKKAKEIKKDAPPEEAAPGKMFDFGGLPDRDLKKNLGCG